MRNRVVLGLTVMLSVAAFPAVASYARKRAAENRGFQNQIASDQKIMQALNRLTFGPRPGDVQAVKAVGLKKWIDQQLHPEAIAENPVLTAKLQTMDTLRMSERELVRNYPTPQMVRQMVSGQMPFPSDPDRRLVLTRLVERFEKRQAAGGDPNQQAPAPDVRKLNELLTPQQIRTLRQGTAQQRLDAFLALDNVKQDEVVAALPAGMRQNLFAAAPPEVRRRIELANGPQQVVARDLMEGKLLRAVYSNRQLEEVLADFWFNHFNVFLDKGADRYMVTGYERDAIRPHVLGKFKDLLEATAKSPAMLFYLDNWQSVGPNAPQARGKKGASGLNENYGRELLELHTLGVDGGYTQKDVTEAARCFTGWTIQQPQRGGTFVFNRRAHDDGEKTVLGVKIPAGGGIEDGEKVLDIVARHPATARFISRKLAMRFVADDPPEALVKRMAETFQKTDGDLRAVMKTMLESREFFSVAAYQSKMKSPLEVVASAARALNADIDYAFPLANQVAQLGEPLYRKQEPTGYSNNSREWLNSAGLMARMNFALQLADNKIPGVKVNAADLTGIALGSPEFQKR
ncbi:MAG TPA: DUF1800 domain-containing protein [Candidatus Acidoferrales bacterium]|nr:DUF1800 domain-containing protein [Bryobacteraceae bacterium]HTS62700.1 DUF1800 domain-containing protein [Candidatus Acidoferrales bacterium]